MKLSQSTISQSLSDLERHLGVELFERLGRRLQLNSMGSYLLPRAERLLEGMADFVAVAEDPESQLQGTLNVSASATTGTYCAAPSREDTSAIRTRGWIFGYDCVIPER